ncbi:MAG: hypothetical protein ABIR35_11070, partial [Polaromonas sp.]
GIYEGVKTGDMACAQSCFVAVCERLMLRHGEIALIMGCTEIPLALTAAPQAAPWMLVNPAMVLAQALAGWAYAGESLPGVTPAQDALKLHQAQSDLN